MYIMCYYIIKTEQKWSQILLCEVWVACRVILLRWYLQFIDDEADEESEEDDDDNEDDLEKVLVNEDSEEESSTDDG